MNDRRGRLNDAATQGAALPRAAGGLTRGWGKEAFSLWVRKKDGYCYLEEHTIRTRLPRERRHILLTNSTSCSGHANASFELAVCWLCACRVRLFSASAWVQTSWG